MLNSVPISFEVKLSCLLLKDPVPAGMNPYVLMGMVPKYRNTTEHLRPVTVKWLEKDIFRIMDGRHRFFASVIAGRQTLLCQLDQNSEVPDVWESVQT